MNSSEPAEPKMQYKTLTSSDSIHPLNLLCFVGSHYVQCCGIIISIYNLRRHNLQQMYSNIHYYCDFKYSQLLMCYTKLWSYPEYII